YCVPGPARILTGDSAVAGIAATAPAESTRADAAESNVILRVMGCSLLDDLVACVKTRTRAPMFRTFPKSNQPPAGREKAGWRPLRSHWLTLARHNPAGREPHHVGA